MERVELPSRKDVISILKKLIDKSISPEAASSWASSWLLRSDDINDLKVLRAIESIAAADLPSTDRQYLYGRADFEKWLNELER